MATRLGSSLNNATRVRETGKRTVSYRERMDEQRNLQFGGGVSDGRPEQEKEREREREPRVSEDCYVMFFEEFGRR